MWWRCVAAERRSVWFWTLGEDRRVLCAERVRKIPHLAKCGIFVAAGLAGGGPGLWHEAPRVR